MSFCSNCGAQLENENAQFCTNCGAKIGETAVESAPVSQVSAPVAEPTAQFGMKWYKFLIYFALFLGAVVNFINGVNYLTGNIYFVQSGGEATAEMIYAFFGSSLKTIDIIFGIGSEIPRWNC